MCMKHNDYICTYTYTHTNELDRKSLEGFRGFNEILGNRASDDDDDDERNNLS